MTASESGIYITLIALMYERGGEIENCPPRLCRLCGSSNSAFKRALEVLISEGKITQNGNLLSNSRVVEELSYTREKSSVARESANRRWDKKVKVINGGNDANAMQTQCDGNANQKPEAIKKNTKRKIQDILEKVIDRERALAVIEHRIQLKRPLTAHGAKLLSGKFGKWKDPNAAADKMIERGWQGFEPEWMTDGIKGTDKPTGSFRKVFEPEREIEQPPEAERDKQARAAQKLMRQTAKAMQV